MSGSEFGSDTRWFKQLFDASPDPTWIIDANQFVECNEAAVRTLGYASREALLNIHPSKLAPLTQPDGQDSFTKAEQMMAFAREHGLHRFEWMHVKADGAEIIAEVTLWTITLGDKKVICSVWRDIRERKKIEQQLLRQNTVLSAVIENFPGGISLFDADLRLVAHNQMIKQLLELPDSLFDKKDACFEDFIRFNAERGDYGAGDPEQQIAAILARTRNFVAHKIERVRPNGTALEIRGMPLPGGGFVTVYLDITDRKLAEQQQRIAATAFEAQEGMMITDAHATILRVNHAFIAITGYTAQDAIGQTPQLLKSGRHDAAFYAEMTRCLHDHGLWEGEIWNRRKNGEVFPEWLTITAVKDEAGQISNYVATLTDITRRKEAEEEIKNLAFYDPLTQLPNRRLLNDRLKQAMAGSKRRRCYGALMFLDLDNFKPLNDAHGHEVGDLLLIEAADRLRSHIREVDTAARFGGDEFVVLLHELHVDKTEAMRQAAMVAEKIRETLSQPYRMTVKHGDETEKYVEHHCTVSIGVALFENYLASECDVLKFADAAMYQAKEAGRNSVCFATAQ